MKRFCLNIFLACAVVSFAGCAPKEPPIWETVKISDVLPRHPARKSPGPLLKKADFKVYIFDIPAENVDVLDQVWPMLSEKPLKFDNRDAFAANQFSVGFGQVRSWNKIADLLRDAKAKKVMTVSLMIPHDLGNDLTIAEFARQKSIFYIAADRSSEGLTVETGALVLRIKAEPIPTAKGLCRVTARPLYTPQVRTAIRQLAALAKAGERSFDGAGFELNMAPDDFVFLGPKKFIDNQITLGGLFFTIPDHEPLVRTYLIVCKSINY